MRLNIKESMVDEIIKQTIKESAIIPSKNAYYINIMVPRIKSWMEEVYQDWGGIDAVSPQALMDFSNRNDYEETLDTYANEFSVDKEKLRPVLNKAIEIAHNELKSEIIGEGRKVDRFTNYTPEEKARNFEYLRTGFGRSPEERNPYYAKALKAAQERMRQRKLQKQKNNESIEEVMNYGAERVASDNNYVNRWFEKNVEPIFKPIDTFMSKGAKPDNELFSGYQTLRNLYNCHPLKMDSRLIDVKQRIYDKLIEVEKYVQSFYKHESKQNINNRIDETVKNVLKQYLKEDGYSYNGLDTQAEYNKMGADLLNQENRQKYYKKNIILFKKAYNKIYKEYTIIRQIKRKAPETKSLFDGQLFLKYVHEVEGDTLYEPIWKKYGGEYKELADQYLQEQVIRLRKELDI